MAVDLLTRQVSDLCIGKPSLKYLPISATLGDAIQALKHSDENFISVWSCISDKYPKFPTPRDLLHIGVECECVGKICMVDVICFLCKHDSLSTSTALDVPLSDLFLPLDDSKLVLHVQANTSFDAAIDLILQGAQNLIIPIQNSNNRYQQGRRKTGLTGKQSGHEFCWLSEEDIIRFFLSSINFFSQIASVSIESLGIITADYLSVNYHSPASSASELISQSVTDQTSVAVVNDDGQLLGEISPITLCCCDETVAAAIATLSIGELTSYIDCHGAPDELMKLENFRLKERNLGHMYEEVTKCRVVDDYSFSDISSNSSVSSLSSSDDDYDSSVEESSVTMLAGRRPRRYSRSWADAIVCREGSSLLAVMIQAIAHRVNYVWVIADDCMLVGIVTFSCIIDVIREHILCYY